MNLKNNKAGKKATTKVEEESKNEPQQQQQHKGRAQAGSSPLPNIRTSSELKPQPKTKLAPPKAPASKSPSAAQLQSDGKSAKPKTAERTKSPISPMQVKG